jgi:hypothetical protein
VNAGLLVRDLIALFDHALEIGALELQALGQCVQEHLGRLHALGASAIWTSEGDERRTRL